jgi:hypothetical protein
MDAFLKKIFLTCTLIIFSISTVSAIDLDKTYVNEDVKLVLNGQGIRDKFFMDLYECGLYLTQKSQNAKQIIEEDKPMNLKLHIVSSLITSEKMENATREGFEKSTNGSIESLQSEIETFIRVFKDLKDNDKYNFFYLPNTGVKIYKNDKLASTIEGIDFKKALFGIWLGTEPAQENLKNGLLSL